MSKLLNQWVDVFRAGDYGEKGNYSESDVQQMAVNYDPLKHEAPAVIGHPKMDAPAYGWVDKVRSVGPVLQAQFRQVVPAFAEMVENGQFKKRSASFYEMPDGSFSLRHVGFLGAQPPVVKGLADIAFSEEDKQAIYIDFSEEDEMDHDKVADSIWEKLKGKFTPAAVTVIPASDAPKQFGEEDVKKIIELAVKPLQDKLDAQERTFAESKTADATAASKRRASEAIGALKTEGKWLPAFDLAGLPLVFGELAKDVKTVEFGEGDAKKTQTPLEIFTGFLRSQPKYVPSGRVVDQGASPAAGKRREFGEGVDQNSVKLMQITEEIMSKDSKLTYAEAGRKAAQEHPELTLPGGASAGQV